MNDLTDSLVDEDPVVFAGLLSTEVGSSLYPEHQRSYQSPAPTPAMRKRNGLPWWKEGQGEEKLRDGRPFSGPGVM